MHTFKLNNMNTKHTPGPWSGKDGQIYSAQTGKTISLLSYFDKDEEQDKANQQLIAAAPELLELVKRMQQTIELMRMGHREEPAEKSVLAAADRILSQINE